MCVGPVLVHPMPLVRSWTATQHLAHSMLCRPICGTRAHAGRWHSHASRLTPAPSSSPQGAAQLSDGSWRLFAGLGMGAVLEAKCEYRVAEVMQAVQIMRGVNEGRRRHGIWPLGLNGMASHNTIIRAWAGSRTWAMHMKRVVACQHG